MTMNLSIAHDFCLHSSKTRPLRTSKPENFLKKTTKGILTHIPFFCGYPCRMLKFHNADIFTPWV